MSVGYDMGYTNINAYENMFAERLVIASKLPYQQVGKSCQYSKTFHFFLELITFVNYRLPFVEKDDKQEYLRDYKEEVKKTKLVKIIEDKETGEKTFDATFDIIIGVISKPL